MWQQGEEKGTKEICRGIKIQYSIKGYHKVQHYNLIFDKASLGKLLETFKAPNTTIFFHNRPILKISKLLAQTS